MIQRTSIPRAAINVLLMFLDISWKM